MHACAVCSSRQQLDAHRWRAHEQTSGSLACDSCQLVAVGPYACAGGAADEDSEPSRMVGAKAKQAVGFESPPAKVIETVACSMG